jgi:hypothetical protein
MGCFLVGAPCFGVELLTRQALARIDQNAVILWVIDLHGREELSETGSRDCVDKSDAFDKALCAPNRP